MIVRPLTAGLLALSFAWPALGQTPTSIVAAENFYGDVARQIAGPEASVTSVISSPDQDPHLFEASPSTARELAKAQIVIENGAGYDTWLDRMLRATQAPGRVVISAATLAHWREGGNPHLWYDPALMPAVAQALAAALSKSDPARKDAYAQRLQAFQASLQPLDAKIAAMRKRFSGAPVTATEPVFGLMAKALGLAMRNERFQQSVMNETEPRASDVARFAADLRERRVRALLYNKQATGPMAERMLDLAKQAGVPVVGVTETAPAGMTYQEWMTSQLDALETALAAGA